MSSQRILYIIRGVRGGVEVVVDQLSNRLDRNRYEPIVLFDTDAPSFIREKLHASDIKTIDLQECRKNQVYRPLNIRKSFNISKRVEAHFGKKARYVYLSLKSLNLFLKKQSWKILQFVQILREFKIKLVHTHNDLTSAKPEIIAAFLVGIPCVSHSHGYLKLTHFDRLFSRFVHTFIYISKDVAQHHDSQGKPRSKGKIVYNGIDVAKFRQTYEIDSIRKEFGIKPKHSLTGIIGRIDWWKGHEYYIEAMAKAIKQNADLRGLIIGAIEEKVAISKNQKYYQKLKLLIDQYGLGDKILFTGFRNDVPRLIAALDIVVHASSIPEPFGLVVIEGMAAGKPVVATAAGGVLEIIENGVNGVLVPCKDSAAMARAILKIISSPEMALEIGIAAQKRVVEKFTIQRQVLDIEYLYDSILGDYQHKRGSCNH